MSKHEGEELCMFEIVGVEMIDEVVANELAGCMDESSARNEA